MGFPARDRVGCVMRFRVAACIAGFLAAPTASAVVFQDDLALDGTTAQGQVFYSQTVSRVADANAAACLVSTGSDWKKTARARVADDFARRHATGADIDEAFRLTIPVAVDGLSSNTPYLMFVTPRDGDTFARIATGFAIRPDTLLVTYGPEETPLEANDVEIEPRGDTAVIRDPLAVSALRSAFAGGESIGVVARSMKTDPRSEHVIGYTFRGVVDERAFEACLSDLAGGDDLAVSQVASFSLAPVTDLDGAARQSARGMACNRQLDPQGADLMRLDGPIMGFATPLSHALVQRNVETGEIQHIWSGDLWRISRVGRGYEIAFSNSVTSQSPIAEQTEKACTQFARARCATLTYVGDRFTVGACAESYIAGAGLTVGPEGPYLGFPVSATPPAAPANGTGTGSAGAVSLAGFGGGGIGAPAGQIATYLVVSGSVDGDTSAGGLDGTPAPVPVPAGGLMLALILPIAWGLRRRGTGTS